MPIEDIKEKIISEANINAQKIINNAKDKEREIIEKAEKDAENIKEKILNQIKKEIAISKEKIITEANLEARKNILSTKQEIMNKVFNQALNKIIELDDIKYQNFIKKIILNNVEKGNETIFISSKDKKRINNIFIQKINQELIKNGKEGNLSLSDTFLDIKGGIVIGSGNIRKNSSLELIFEKIREELEGEISKNLFN